MKIPFSKTKSFPRAKKALLRAIRLCATQKNLADKCNSFQQEVSQWLTKGVPPSRVIAVEKAVHGAVTRHELRPDIYPKE